MIFQETKLAGAFVVELEPHLDERGFFARTFCEREFEEHGLPTRFPQCNLSRNRHAATLRGMHFQTEQLSEAKLVRCTSGAILDVIVDIRRSSPTFLQWVAVELSEEAGRALYIPQGFAHGFLTLRSETDVFYHMSEFYRSAGACGFRWNDPRVGISWPREPAMISERDATYPDLDVEECYA